MTGQANGGRRAHEGFRVAGLFAGVGGLELGLQRAGHRTALLCEIDPAARAVLTARFEAPLWDDVNTLPPLPRGTDVLTAGFPCQNLSQAGRTEGIDGMASGLVRRVFDVLDRSPVRWVLLENVPFMMRLQKGRALEFVLGELERRRYRWAYRVVDSRAFGLPQRRQRVFILAARDDDPRRVLLADDAGARPAPDERPWGSVAYGFYWTEGWRGIGWAVDSVPPLKGGSGIGIPAPPAVLMPAADGRIVTPGIRDAERLQGFAADWTKPVESLGSRGQRWRWRLVGNAVTVRVAEWIGKRLAAPKEFDSQRGAPLGGGTWPSAAWNVDGKRYTAEVSQWPVRRTAPALASFLREPDELSARATAGFLSRVVSDRATIRCRPEFVSSLRRHLHRVEKTAVAPPPGID